MNQQFYTDSIIFTFIYYRKLGLRKTNLKVRRKKTLSWNVEPQNLCDISLLLPEIKMIIIITIGTIARGKKLLLALKLTALLKVSV
jgi:hypothetical protein